MALVATPRQLSLRAELYHQLGALLSAGLPIIKSIESLASQPPARRFRHMLHQILGPLQEGESLTRALAQASEPLPLFDLALLRAGEESGRLPEILRLLAAYYRERAQQIRSLIGELVYPVFLFHVAIFIGPFPKLFLGGNIVQYLWQTVGFLIPIYVGVFLFALACQGSRGETWRGLIEAVCRFVPMLGRARQSLALSRLSAALEAQITAGVSIINAWELAAGASASPAIARTVRGWRPQLESSEKTPSDMVSAAPVFPQLFANFYSSGEVSGQLDESLERLHAHYQEEGTRLMRSFIKIFSMLVYLAITLKVAIQVIGGYQSHYGEIFRNF